MKKVYLRRVTTKSTLDWVMGKIEKGHKGNPIYLPKLQQDRETIQRWLTDYGWYKEMPIKDPFANITMVGVGRRDEIADDHAIVAMGHYFKLYQTYQNQKHVLWIVPR